MNFLKTLIFLFFVLATNASAQNIFDAQHSESYAKYLYQNKNYEQAVEEYQRVLFYYPDSNNIRKAFLLACFKSNNFELGEKEIRYFSKGNFEKLPKELSFPYFQFLLVQEKYAEAQLFLNGKGEISAQNACIAQLSIFLLQEQWKKGLEYSTKNCIESKDSSYLFLQGINRKAVSVVYKKPFTAVALSAIVPGGGKIYTGNYKDALVSFLMVAGNGWQAYRGFKKKGAKSTYGWIFASLSVGFYIGNLYGSYTAVKRRNLRYNHEIKHQLEDYLFN